MPEATGPYDSGLFLNQIPPEADVCLTVHCVNSEKLIERLKTSGNVSKALSFSNFGSRYEAEQKFLELDELIREIRGSAQRLFTFSLTILVKALDRTSLESQSAAALKAFQDMGSAVGLADHLNHDDLFLSFFRTTAISTPGVT